MKEIITVNNNKRKMYLLIAIIGTILLVGGVSYAILTLLITGTEENVIHSGNLALNLDENKSINLTSAIPITDEEGLQGEAYVFSVENTGTIEAGYTIYLDDATLQAGENKIPGSSIKYELKVNGTCSHMGNLSEGATTLHVDNIKTGVVTNFELRLWIAYEVTTLPSNGTHRSNLRIEASQELIDPANLGTCSIGNTESEPNIEHCFTFADGVIYDYVLDYYGSYPEEKYADCPTDNIKIPENINGETVVEISDLVFESRYITNIELPNTLEILNLELAPYTEVTTITIPSSVTKLKGNPVQKAFVLNKSSLAEFDTTEAYIYSSDGFTFIDDSVIDLSLAFTLSTSNKNTIANVNMPVYNEIYHNKYGKEANGVLEIPTMVNGNNITKICNSLDWANNPNCFSNLGLKEIIIHDGITEIIPNAFSNNELPPESAFIYARSSDGSIDNTTLVSYAGAEKESVIIPNNVLTISSLAFANTKVNEINTGTGVTTINYDAFSCIFVASVPFPELFVQYNCPLEKITIGSSVEHIEGSLFTDVSSVNNITILGKSSESDFTTIDEYSWIPDSYKQYLTFQP